MFRSTQKPLPPPLLLEKPPSWCLRLYGHWVGQAAQAKSHFKFYTKLRLPNLAPHLTRPPLPLPLPLPTKTVYKPFQIPHTRPLFTSSSSSVQLHSLTPFSFLVVHLIGCCLSEAQIILAPVINTDVFRMNILHFFSQVCSSIKARICFLQAGLFGM